MKSNAIKIAALVICTVSTLTACRTKDRVTAVPDAPAADTSSVKIEVFNVSGSSALNLDIQNYVNANGDTFKVSMLNYYLSNFKLNRDTGAYIEDYSYHLVKQSESASHIFDLHGVPYGTYNSITFTIGVDSAHNVSGTQTGALDPMNNMFWGWTTGYVMLKIEGSSPSSPNVNNAFALHAGGFSGAYNTVRTVTLTLPSPITVTKNGINHIHLTADIQKLLGTPHVIDFAVTNGIHMPGADAKMLADNYATMFTSTYSGL